ncbi:MAG: ABC transporter ATP-binding protein [Pseudonocardiaceae bacterium]
MNAVELRAVSKSYARTPVLREVTLTIADTAVTAILGPSGSGKTTLLRLIAGFDRADGGTITVGERVVDHPGTHVRPEHRGIGYVPQGGDLFPHLTVARNISFGLPRRDRHQISDLIELVGLAGLNQRYPHQLSGGQQQRVALARALAIRPRLVLLDEPFSSLDASLRVSLRRDVARVLAEAKTPAVIVTHDQDEALSLAGRIAILDHGRVLAEGSPAQLYTAPTNPATARYLGQANLLPATITAGTAQCVLGALRLHAETSPPDGPATVLLRPQQLCLSTDQGGDGAPATISALDYHGHDSLAELTLADATTLTARLTGNQALRTGDHVRVRATSPAIAWPPVRDRG